MALGRRRRDDQQVLWLTPKELPRAPGHPFYARLNALLAEISFDDFVENVCAPFYAGEVGRPGLAPGVYFRMLFVGYFEGLDSQRGIAWRCADSLALREFLGIPLGKSTPDHSTLTLTRQRLPIGVYHQVFDHVLRLTAERGLLSGNTLGVDATQLEANAAMKSIVRRDSGEDWKAYVKRLAEEEGVEAPKNDDARRFDKKRKGKKVSNDDWQSPSDPDARIARMKDGTTHLAYKAEHAVDLKSGVVVAAEVYPANTSDAESAPQTIEQARDHLVAAVGPDTDVREVVADRGYHKTELLAKWAEDGIRTYVCEPKVNGERRWNDKPREWREAFTKNHRRVRGERSRQLQRWRSERVERVFAHACETGGGRRTYLRGLWNVAKRHLALIAALNLGVVLRAMFGAGTPRELRAKAAAVALALLDCILSPAVREWLFRVLVDVLAPGVWDADTVILGVRGDRRRPGPSSTGC